MCVYMYIYIHRSRYIHIFVTHNQSTYTHICTDAHSRHHRFTLSYTYSSACVC